MTQPEETNLQFELAPAQVSIPLKVTHAGRGYRVVHRLRPPGAEDWFAYEAALRLAVEELPPEPGSDETRYRFDVHSSEAALELWGRLALAAEGYASLPEGDDDDWRGHIPLAHKEAAVRALTLVAPADLAATEETGEGFPLAAEQVPVVLEAVRDGLAISSLVHLFRPPSVEDERRYRRLMAEAFLVGGARTTRTLIPARLPALCRLYDALILSVEGYAIEGQPPSSSTQVAEHMDAWHKRTAVQSLFGDASDAESIAPPQSEISEIAQP